MAFTPDGRWFIHLGKIRNVQTWKVEKELPEYETYWDTSVVVSPDSTKLAIGTREGEIVLYELPSAKMLRRINAHSNVVTGVAFVQDSNTLISASLDRMVRKWDLKSELLVSEEGKPTHVPPEGYFVGYSGSIDKLALSRDDSMLATCDFSDRITIQNTEDGSIIRKFNGSPDGYGFVMDMNFSPNGEFLVVVAGDGCVVHSTREDTDPTFIKSHSPNGILDMAWLGNTSEFTLYYRGSHTNGVVEFFDFESRKSLGAFVPHRSFGMRHAFSPDGQYLATSGKTSGIGDALVRIWETKKRRTKLYDELPPPYKEMGSDR